MSGGIAYPRATVLYIYTKVGEMGFGGEDSQPDSGAGAEEFAKRMIDLKVCLQDSPDFRWVLGNHFDAQCTVYTCMDFIQGIRKCKLDNCHWARGQTLLAVIPPRDCSSS